MSHDDASLGWAKNSRLQLWGAFVLALAFGSTAHAQMDFGEDPDSVADDGGGMDFGEDPDATGDGGMDFGDNPDGVDSGDGSMDFGTDPDAGGDDLLSGGIQNDEVSRPEMERITESVEEVYAVQRIYALRLNRFEVSPSAAFTLNDPFVSRPAVGLALNYWFTNVLAVGVNALWYQFQDQLTESDLNFFTRRNTRLGVPISQWQFGAYLNFTYVPFYGKFSVFNKLIFEWDAYIVGGVGMMRTRPVPIIDPAIRGFDFGLRVGFNLGIGLRIFVTRYLGITVEFRDYMFLERYENVEVSPVPSERQDSSTWFADSPTFTNNLTTQIGFTLFFPFTFDYELPK